MKFGAYFVLTAALLGSAAGRADPAPEVEIFKSTHCSCCGAWVKHMTDNGFTVNVHEVSDVPQERRKLGMPDRLGSCHSAHVGAYVIEGHVPAADVARLLKQNPKALGLAVPGMVPGSPGMETDKPLHYDTLLVLTDGSTRIFARH